MKSEGCRLGSAGIRRTSIVACFCHEAGLAYDPRTWPARVWTQKSEKRSTLPLRPGASIFVLGNVKIILEKELKF